MIEELSVYWEKYNYNEIPKCCKRCKYLLKFVMENEDKGIACKKNAPIILIGDAGTTGLLTKFTPIKKCSLMSSKKRK